MERVVAALHGNIDGKIQREEIGGTFGRSVVARATIFRALIRGGRVRRLLVYKLGRGLTHLALKVPLIASSQGIDTSEENPAGSLQLGVLMAVAEFERGIIRERVTAGLAAAMKRGVKLGRPATLKAYSKAVGDLKNKGLGVRAIARELKMPPSSVSKVLSMQPTGSGPSSAFHSMSRCNPIKSPVKVR
jgi:hypothetical protein